MLEVRGLTKRYSRVLLTLLILGGAVLLARYRSGGLRRHAELVFEEEDPGRAQALDLST